jgi:ABC-2 type transport system permease protein
MNESAEIRAATAPQSAARTSATQPLLTLLKREVWEHPALWIAPLVVMAALLLGAIFGRAYGPRTMPIGDVTGPAQSAQAMATTVVVVTFGGLQYFVLSVVLWFYATACLYNERRDRSILFWKSMPVSDLKTVLSKFLIAFAAAPLYVYVVTVLTTLAAAGIWTIRGFSGSAPISLWDGAAWARAEAFAFVWLVFATLWYAPLTAYLLLISAWARRNVQLWALSPFVAIIVERIAFGTHYLSTWLLYRLLPGWQSQWEQWFERLFTGPFYYTSGGPANSAGVFAGMEPLRGLENIDLWIGLAVAVAFLYATVRIRQYRDDT